MGEIRYYKRHFKKFDVKSVRVFKSCRSDGTPYDIVMDGHPFFGYFFNEGEGVKIYRPGQALRFLYAGHFPIPMYLDSNNYHLQVMFSTLQVVKKMF